MEVCIRPLKTTEHHILAEMLYQAIFVPKGAPKPPREIVERPELQRYIADWPRAGDVAFVAVVEEKKVGLAWARLFSESNPGYGFVNAATPELSIAVIPEYRGKGIGTRLLERLMNELRNTGFTAVSLSVNPENRAVHLYQRLGFEIVEKKGTSYIMKCDLHRG